MLPRKMARIGAAWGWGFGRATIGLALGPAALATVPELVAATGAGVEGLLVLLPVDRFVEPEPVFLVF